MEPKITSVNCYFDQKSYKNDLKAIFFIKTKENTLNCNMSLMNSNEDILNLKVIYKVGFLELHHF